MKKKMIRIMTVLLAAGLMSGCAKSDADKSLNEMAVEKYVTLGEYKGIGVTVEPINVDQADVDMRISAAYSNYATGETGQITDRAVQTGDIVNIDFVGKKDDVAFEGGTAQGSNLVIGSGQFISGFEEGLVGVMPGETVDLNLTFPESYQQNVDLAGQDVVFTVTVNYIVPFEDEIIGTMGIEGVNTVEEFRQYALDSMNGSAQSTYEGNVENAVLDAFMNACVFTELPQEMTDKYQQMARDGMDQQAVSYGMDAESLAQAMYGMDLESFVVSYGEMAVKQDLAMQAVANAENLNIDDEELNTTLQEYAANAGYETVEEFIGEQTLEDYRNYFMFEKVLDFLVENAVINEN